MKYYYLTAPGMYIGAHSVVRALDETAARLKFGAALLTHGCQMKDCTPMSCREINDAAFHKDTGIMAMTNGDY